MSLGQTSKFLVDWDKSCDRCFLPGEPTTNTNQQILRLHGTVRPVLTTYTMTSMIGRMTFMIGCRI